MSSPRTSVVHNVIDVLRCFSKNEPLIAVTEIGQQVDLHKSSVSRLLATLESEGWVEQDPATRKYHLGFCLFAIAGPSLAILCVRLVASPYLQKLSFTSHAPSLPACWDVSPAFTVVPIASQCTTTRISSLGAQYASAGSATVQTFLA